MTLGWIRVAAAAAVLLVSGCSSGEPPSSTPSGQVSASPSASVPGQESSEAGAAQSSTALAPQAPLGSEGCIDVTSANLNLAVADNAEQARAAADVIAGFGPPPSVTEALDHFVGTGGVQADDPEFNEYNTRIDDWVKAVCPL